MVTNQAGSVIERYDYRPFGDACASACGSQGTNERIQFAGQETDLATGFDYFGARHYAVVSGRFTTADPDHVAGSVLDPQSWNAYSYARNNPLTFVDPEGRFFVATDNSALEKEFAAIRGWLHGQADYYFDGFKLGTRAVDFVSRLFFPQEIPPPDPFAIAPMGMAVGPAGKAASSVLGTLSRDATGKIHGILPRVAQLKNAPRAAIRETIRELRGSILARQQELARLGEDGAHRARIGAEERLLRSLEKALENMLGAKNVP
jgi:RHS repeat-associated protein